MGCSVEIQQFKMSYLGFFFSMGLDDLVVNERICSSPWQSVLTKMTVRTIAIAMITNVCTTALRVLFLALQNNSAT